MSPVRNSHDRKPALNLGEKLSSSDISNGVSEILYCIKGSVATITINRPEKYNALFGNMREDIYSALKSAGEDKKVRAVIITGAGKAFCTGSDVNYLAEIKARGDKKTFAKLLEAGRDVILLLRQLPKPVIAKINGAAAGAGLNITLACDLRIASSNATFGETFCRIGLQPDWGGTYFLPRIVGIAEASEMALAGEMIDAKKAQSIGLVNYIFSPEQIDEATLKMAEKLAKAAPEAVKSIKESLFKLMQKDLESALSQEIEAQLKLFDTNDFAEGLRAFLEKREVKFSDKL